jgi:AcrR family transcriptional regulator
VATARNGPQEPLERRRRPTKGDRREQALLDSFEALLGEHSFAEVSVDQIALRAGVSRTAFYFYFPNKAAALASIIDRSAMDIWRVPDSYLTGEGDPAVELEQVVRATVDTWVAQGKVLSAALELAGSDEQFWQVWREQLEGFIEAAAARIERDRTRGLAPPGPPARPLASALCWMIERYCFVALCLEPRTAPEEVVAVLCHAWWSSIYG